MILSLLSNDLLSKMDQNCDAKTKNKKSSTQTFTLLFTRRNLYQRSLKACWTCFQAAVHEPNGAEKSNNKFCVVIEIYIFYFIFLVSQTSVWPIGDLKRKWFDSQPEKWLVLLCCKGKQFGCLMSRSVCHPNTRICPCKNKKMFCTGFFLGNYSKHWRQWGTNSSTNQMFCWWADYVNWPIRAKRNQTLWSKHSPTLFI